MSATKLSAMASTPDFVPAEPQPTDPAGTGAPADGATVLPPGRGWTDGSAAPKKPNTRLPWIVVVMLGVLSAALIAICGVQAGQLSTLRQQLDDARKQASAAPAAQASAPAQPSQDQAAIETMRKLPHRRQGDPLALGKVDAPVVMVEWSDLRCPFCSVWSRDTLPQLKPYIDSGSLRIEHRDLVLFGDQSQLAAQAARAAANQGRFWEFDQAVHAVAPTSGHPDISKADLVAFARKAGVPDIARFTTDMTSAAAVKAVNADTTEARGLGISGTPFFVINTTPMSGAQPLASFTQVIEANGGHK